MTFGIIPGYTAGELNHGMFFVRLSKMMKKRPETAIVLQLDDIRSTLLRNTITLEEHVKRTSLLEQNVEKIHAEIIPLKIHVAMWGGAGKVLTVSASMGALIFGILQLIKHF